jgi:hypothetical protein
MSVLDKWRMIHRQNERVATSATSATNPNTHCDANDLDVASGLRQVATFPMESPNVAKCRNGFATNSILEDQLLTGNVADVADVARGQNLKTPAAIFVVEGASKETRRPLVLDDSRRMHWFPAASLPDLVGDRVLDLLHAARLEHSAVLVGDGMTLIVVEPRRRLPPELLADLRDNAGAVIAVLRGEHRERVSRLPPDQVAVYEPGLS